MHFVTQIERKSDRWHVTVTVNGNRFDNQSEFVSISLVDAMNSASTWAKEIAISRRDKLMGKAQAV